MHFSFFGIVHGRRLADFRNSRGATFLYRIKASLENSLAFCNVLKNAQPIGHVASKIPNWQRFLNFNLIIKICYWSYGSFDMRYSIGSLGNKACPLGTDSKYSQIESDSTIPHFPSCSTGTWPLGFNFKNQTGLFFKSISINSKFLSSSWLKTSNKTMVVLWENGQLEE